MMQVKKMPIGSCSISESAFSCSLADGKITGDRKHPTAEKVEAIKDALRHFEIIS